MYRLTYADNNRGEFPMDKIVIQPDLQLSKSELEISAVRSQGAGGQHVNKTSTAIQLRFDIKASSLPDSVKQKLLQKPDSRLNREGVLIIKAQQSRSQESNRNSAIEQLVAAIRSVLVERKPRKKTNPSKKSVAKRIESKKRQGQIKALRQKIRQ